MTVVCIICNIAYITVMLFENYMSWHTFELGWTWDYIVHYVFSTTLHFLNASINPLIFITRGSELREYVMSYVRYFTETLRRYLINTLRTLYRAFTRGNTIAIKLI